MRDAVVFNVSNQLEFQEVRMNVTRIPEVLARVREAEDAWDESLGHAAASELATFLSSEDERFAAGPRRRLVVVGVVQVGLYDRFVRTHGTPEFLIGAPDGPVAVALGLKSMSDFVLDTARSNSISPAKPTWWQRSDATWTKLNEAAPHDRLVSIGPGGAGATAVDSIDLDAALSWFWTSLSASRLAIAN